MNGQGIPLRVAVAAGKHVRMLRRYTLSPELDCPAGGYHNASRVLCTVPEGGQRAGRDDDWPHDDANWPPACGCGYQFGPSDRWQRADYPVYRLPDGAEFTFSRSLGMVAPPGTMVRLPWWDEFAPGRGESWCVALPGGGDWVTTQDASGGGQWTVTGIPPNITVTPSIWNNRPGGWHGWIRDGHLTDC